MCFIITTHSVFIIDNQCFSLKKVGNSKYVFYTLSKRATFNVFNVLLLVVASTEAL
jgi:hypothetical protein